VERTPDYQRDGISLYLGDCLEVSRHIGSVDCVITSPPYNLGGEPWPHLGNWKPGASSGGNSKWKNGCDAGAGVQYSSHNDSMPWDEYVAWQQSVLACLWDLLPGDGAIFYNHKPRVIGAKLWTPMELIPPAVILRQIVIWSRPGGMNFNPTAFVPTHEWVMVLARDLFRLKSKAVSGLGDVWRLNPDKNDHPAPFPVALPAKILEAIRARVVFDPFMGSGSTAIACIQAGCEFVGSEKDAAYFEMAVKRIDKALDDDRDSLWPAKQLLAETQNDLFA
jgi:site-specific DNA-methyltransferase (adenine-specific)